MPVAQTAQLWPAICDLPLWLLWRGLLHISFGPASHWANLFLSSWCLIFFFFQKSVNPLSILLDALPICTHAVAVARMMPVASSS